MSCVDVRTQAELDAALKEDGNCVHCVGDGRFVIGGSSSVVAWESSSVVARESSSVEARESSSVVAWGSSSVEAWGSSSVVAWESSSVVARESSSVVARESSRVVARESSSVVARESSRVVARESSSVVARESSSVEAWESSSVVARESSRVVATRNVAIHRESCACSLTGGTVIDVVAARSSVPGWIEHYGAEVEGESVVLFKALDKELRSGHGMAYPLGATVEAPDWDPSPERECGGGLHFCAHPVMALDFFDTATRFVACRVALADIRCPRPEDQSPSKVRARRCVVLHEVGRDGKRLDDAMLAAREEGA